LALLARLDTGPVALAPARANEQHYEIPAAFFELVLGPFLKYSCVQWRDGVDDLASAEEATLALTCERAELSDGQEILELGCGWGSLARYIAPQYPNSRIMAVSNSATQRAFIESRRPPNLQVVTADMNAFTTDRRFDRVVSVEMFEHMRNYRLLMDRIAGWLRPGGKLFVHVFCHRRFAYLFETHGAANWMGRHYFTGGLMPSSDLLLHFQDHLQLERRWMVNGTHYSCTARAWRRNLERQRVRVLPVLERTYGDKAPQWFHRWRLFFSACEELFGYRHGLEWLVAHYRFVKPRAQ
jgi:cyclopropane-fatty-acyl-phospholipid synthase